ncbi:hypothetical protein ABZ894_08610, partial [Nocardia beijingensis]
MRRSIFGRNHTAPAPGFERSETEPVPFAARLAFERPPRTRRRSKRRSFSSLNAGLYSTGRILRSMSMNGSAPTIAARM